MVQSVVNMLQMIFERHVQSSCGEGSVTRIPTWCPTFRATWVLLRVAFHSPSPQGDTWTCRLPYKWVYCERLAPRCRWCILICTASYACSSSGRDVVSNACHSHKSIVDGASAGTGGGTQASYARGACAYIGRAYAFRHAGTCCRLPNTRRVRDFVRPAPAACTLDG